MPNQVHCAKNSEPVTYKFTSSTDGEAKEVLLEPCAKVHTKEGKNLIVDSWVPEAAFEYLYYQAQYFYNWNDERVKITRQDDNSMDVHTKDGHRFLTNIAFPKGKQLMATFYTTKRNKKEILKFSSETSRDIIFNVKARKRPAKELGYFHVHGDQGNVQHTNVPLRDSEIIPFQLKYRVPDDQYSAHQHTREFIRLVKIFSNFTKNSTDRRTKLDYVEAKLFGDNPNGDILLLCEIMEGKGASKCNKYR